MHLAFVLVVLEDEVHLAEVGIVRLVIAFNLLLDQFFQFRQVNHALREWVNQPVVAVAADDGASLLHKGEVSLVVGVTPVVIGLELLPGLTKRSQKFLKPLACGLFRLLINLIGEVAEVLGVGFITVKLDGGLVEINV